MHWSTNTGVASGVMFTAMGRSAACRNVDSAAATMELIRQRANYQ